MEEVARNVSEWRESGQTSREAEYVQVRAPTNGTVGEEQWEGCEGVTRNLYVTITRTKESRGEEEGKRRMAEIEVMF